ncbi:MAG TPA: hypothetical protein DCS29_04915 [Candidatus Magasanikbacteria bacterium]|nr:hypothetical protein [Candidatus Magasanikbacteria bacterium]
MYKNHILKDIKAIIFDVDNTLIATDLFVRENIAKTVDRLKGIVTPPSEAEVRLIQAKNPPFEDIFKELFKDELNGRQTWEVVLENYRTHAAEISYTATQGALEAIFWCKQQGFVIGLVTNRTKMLPERLAQAGFSTADFAFICTPPTPELTKPHPRAFEVALQELAEVGIRAEQTIMVGDHPDDYYSASYQNIKFAAVLSGETKRDVFVQIGIEHNFIFENLNNVKNIVEEVLKIDRYKKSLYATSALDGRHGDMSAPLHHYFSEYALHKYRVKTEIEHVVALSEIFYGKVVRLITPDEKKFLRKLYQNFSEYDAYEILQYDHLGRNGIGPTEHDMKSCELWIKEKLQNTSLSDIAPFVHMFVTSEDINNFAYKLMMKEGLTDVFVPDVLEICEKLKELTLKYAQEPVMARTHMQPASPTTFGKIFGNYLVRLVHGLERLRSVKFTAKLNGAVGNYNAFIVAYPDLDWKMYSQDFAKRFGFWYELFTDQRGTHTDMIQALQAVQEIGNVIRDIAQDMSLYAALGTMYFSKVESHVGSSVMPHKINPWFAEVAEGGIKKANWLISGFVSELDVSRLQRDLSDHEFERSYGEAIGYVYIALKHLHIAFDLIKPNCEFARQELQNHPEVVTEAIQTILRKYGRLDAYELVKQESRGKELTLEDLRMFVIKLDVEDKVKQEILTVMDPEKYVGLAGQLALSAVEKYNEFKNSQ